MVWSSKLCLLFIVISLTSIPVQSQQFRNDTQSSGTSTVIATVLSIIGGVILFVGFCMGCGVCCYCLSKQNQRQTYTEPSQAYVHSNYSTEQQFPSSMYNSTYSQATRHNHNEGTGQLQPSPLYYNGHHHQANGSRVLAPRDTRYVYTF